MLFAVVLLLLLNAAPAMACSCMTQPDNQHDAVTHAFSRADSVVLARVVNVSRVRIPYQGHEADGEITEFEGIHSWKGNHGNTFSTKIITECCICGIAFVPGEKYLIYMYGPDKNGFYETSMCTRTVKLRTEKAREEIQILNALAPNKSLNIDGTTRHSLVAPLHAAGYFNR